ncbi:hypothetical protein KQI86_01195 [Clostridium sp. MSJ-11]|uniref:DUF7716 domain-containing protein n=1 Tax=Clostridium mobile TaxID=2841512 RepID=A0ABS6EEM1_9CLOT|nr:hypothetical protein [Clostridium mobile]MBU5482920.1 hypothetical protein [Clostridium mobile]
MEDERCMRTAIKIEELLMVNKDLLDMHALYVEKDVEKFDENTIVYLDNHLGVDEEADTEIYPVFAHKYDLQWFFSGQVVSDIITNTQFQLKNPTVADYIINLNYYNEHDCFYKFIK